jgi:hypothetical protein
MKKMFFLLSIAALVFTSCSNDEQTVETQVQKVPDGAIYFSSGIQDLTRATTTMSTFNAFKVTGLFADNSQSFFNLPVNRSGSLWTYAATEDDYKYWPSDNSDVNFFAYAPTTLAGVDVSSVQQVVENFEQVQHVANQVDVLAAAATGNKTNNASTGMALDFKHALAQIEVRAKNSLTDKYKVEVLGVKLCRIGNKGNMTFQTAATDYPVWALDAESASQSFIKKGTDAIEMTSSVKNIMFGDDNFLLIPQQLKAWTGSDTDVTGAYLSVLCKISQKNEAGDWVTIFPAETTEKTDLYAFTSVPISTKWEVGHKYVYTLDFFGAGGGAGQADPEPVNPEAGDTPDPDVDPNPGTLTDPEKPKDPEEITDPGAGDPVVSDPTLKSVLKFTVSITDWVNGEGDNEKLDL